MSYPELPQHFRRDARSREVGGVPTSTPYYLRSLGATNAEKATIADGALNAVKLEPQGVAPNACAVDDPDCEACQ